MTRKEFLQEEARLADEANARFVKEATTYNASKRSTISVADSLRGVR